ncbi:MAG: HPr family phosphocarrier protein [Lachnospiraceae bacterium]|nr:HPr family phosphocarrier protein [Lachnospiraceae bacterium]
MKKDVKIHMGNVMEATPIANLVALANRFDSTVYLEMDTKKVNAKSIMGMMSLALLDGSEVTIVTEGEDCEQAINEIEEFLAG